MKKQKIPPRKTHTIIISDLHLGSFVSQPKKVLEILKNHSFKKLILLGDIFDSLDLRHFSEDSLKLISYIGKISKEKKVRWVEGNHDAGLSEIFSALIGAKVYRRSYHWHYKREKYFAIHGHQFDRFMINNKIISRIATDIYNFIQKLDSRNKRFSHYLKRKSKGWLRISEKVFHGAILYAKKNEARYIFCGHTHKAMQKTKLGIDYYNSGCWTDSPCTYITIDEKGIKICEY